MSDLDKTAQAAVTQAVHDAAAEAERRLDPEAIRAAAETALDAVKAASGAERPEDPVAEAYRKYELGHHKNRPTVREYIPLIFDGFMEMHGDRLFGDDPAMLTGIAMFRGVPVTVIGTVKGSGTKENIACNFGMAKPEGYRKALRQMKLAEKFGRPIITFIDTSGAYCDIASEERGQSEAIAHNLRGMFGLRVPIVTILTGEGGSGGALALACADRVFILENATYSVISPRGFASLLWKDPSREREAVAKQRMTSDELLAMGVVDRVIPEPPEGAHKDHPAAAANIAGVLDGALGELCALPGDELLERRYEKFRKIGVYNGEI